MIDRCGSLSFAIRGIPSSIRPPNRHSGEGRNTEGKGGTNHTQTLLMTRSHFHTLVCRRPPAWTIGTKIVIRCHRIRHSGEGRNPEGKGGTNHAQTLPMTRSHFHTLVCRRPPAWTIGTKIVIRCHRIRHSRGSGNPEGKGGTNHTQTPPTTRSHFHTLVCRHQPAWTIAMKECPGPRSGIDRCGSLSFAIRGIPSSIRPPNRHSGEGRNPEGKGGTNHTQTPPTTKPRFHTLVRRRQSAWTIGTKIDSRHPSRHSSESWNPEGEVWVTGMRMWTMARRRSVGTRRRVCRALGWGQAPALHFSRSIAACKFTVRGI